MECACKRSFEVLLGLLAMAVSAAPQAYTISAKPGSVNYIEGNAFLNGNPISEKDLKSTFLNTNDTLSTDLGKAEVLLTPGVFLRVGDNSQVRTVSASLTDIQIELLRGEFMIEATGLLKDNAIHVLDHGSVTSIDKNGLYRFTGDDPPVAAVLDGKAQVVFGHRKLDLKKGKQAILSDALAVQKFDPKKDDELYAWSNVRSEYEAAASYRVSSAASTGNLGGWYGFGFNGMVSPGWFYDPAFSSWAWLPRSGAFFSPFGYGFYSPALVGSAPVIAAPVYRGGRWNGGQRNGYSLNSTHHRPPPPGGWHGHSPVNGGVMAAVPVSPNSPAAVGSITASPWANHAARVQARQGVAESGFRTASGAPAAGISGAGPRATPSGSGWHGGGHPGFSGSGSRMNAGGGAHMGAAPGAHMGTAGGSGGHAGGGGGHR